MFLHPFPVPLGELRDSTRPSHDTEKVFLRRSNVCRTSSLSPSWDERREGSRGRPPGVIDSTDRCPPTPSDTYDRRVQPEGSCPVGSLPRPSTSFLQVCLYVCISSVSWSLCKDFVYGPVLGRIVGLLLVLLTHLLVVCGSSGGTQRPRPIRGRSRGKCSRLGEKGT